MTVRNRTHIAGRAEIDMRRPGWLRTELPNRSFQATRSLLKGLGINTVCREARCPNQSECFASSLATFLILGTICSRDCRFCNLRSGAPTPVDPSEPRRVALAVDRLGLDYAVITSVTRDDLPDGGAGAFVAAMDAVRRRRPDCRLELLVPDFGGSAQAIDRVIAARPDVLAHNLETVPRLYPEVRSRADYRRSLTLLERADAGGLLTKSGLMLGLGETDDEVAALLADLRRAGCRLVTLGQYLPPTRQHLPVRRFVPPDEFDRWQQVGLGLGFSRVESGPKVRSSYLAHSCAAALLRPR